MKKDYVKNLERLIRQMLTPLKNVPLNLVIESLSGHKILPFKPRDKKDKDLLVTLTKVAVKAGSTVNKTGIRRARPNEVGNDIEPYVKKALELFGYKAQTPTTSKGNKKTTGYPDIEFTDKYKRINYLECKTYNKENIDTTQRSFYLSPSESFKVTTDAHHLVLSYEIYVDGRVRGKNIYKCKNWKIISVEELLVDVKYEFNSDNRRLYAKKSILAEGVVR